MTRVEKWVQELTESVLGASPVAVGKYYQHPDDGVIRITSGQYWGEHGLSNHWYWQVCATGETHWGYGGDWAEVSVDNTGAD